MWLYICYWNGLLTSRMPSFSAERTIKAIISLARGNLALSRYHCLSFHVLGWTRFPWNTDDPFTFIDSTFIMFLLLNTLLQDVVLGTYVFIKSFRVVTFYFVNAFYFNEDGSHILRYFSRLLRLKSPCKDLKNKVKERADISVVWSKWSRQSRNPER